MKLSNYAIPAELAAPPETCDYSGQAPTVLSQVYINDTLGDCVIAGAYHVVGVETGGAGDLFTATDDNLLHDYGAIGGYVPGKESTDNGCDEQTALNYWVNTGFANGTKLQGYVSVDATNVTEVQQAMFLFENLYFGLELPDTWINPFPSTAGFVWDVGTPDANNGHCVMAVGYNATGVQIDTWGLIGTITWAAVAQLAVETAGGQLYSMLTPDQIGKAQTKAPNGIGWTDLINDFDTLQTASRGGLSKE
jgi:hypothetical protein